MARSCENGLYLISGSENPIALGDIPQGYTGVVFSEDEQDKVDCLGLEDRTLDVKKVLDRFPKLFSNILRTVKGFQHQIRLKQDAQPIVHKVRPLPLSARDERKSVLKSLCDEGVIVLCDSSEWVSPTVIVRKKSGEVRLCADLRTLNKNILIDCHPLPKIHKLLASLGGAPKFFSIVVLRSANHQIPLTTDSQEFTTFITPFGLYKHLRLPFSLASTASVFQKMMDNLFGDMPGVQAYQDDILVFADNWETHLYNLTRVLSKLDEAGMTIRTDKCRFGTQQLDYLGHTLSSEGIKPKLSLIKAVMLFLPKTKISFCHFFGLVFRCYCGWKLIT